MRNPFFILKPPILSSLINNILRFSTQVDTRGWKQLCYFTHWCWCILGAYFIGTILVPIFVPEATWILTVFWEIAAPNAFFVSFIVTTVIWPNQLKANDNPIVDTANLRRPGALLMHNTNMIMVACEIYFAER